MPALKTHARLVLLLAAAAPAILADTEFGATVPREVVQQFIGNPLGGEGKLYSDILAAFPPFSVPQGMEVLASADQGFLQRVILATELEEASVRTALAAAFTAEGWVEIPVPANATVQTGFVNPALPTTLPLQLCHDSHGTLAITVNTGGNRRYANINRNQGARMMGGVQPQCAEQVAMASGGGPALGIRGMAGPALSQYVPRLLLPPPSGNAQSMPLPYMMGGGGGSSNDWEARGSLTSDWTSADIFAHFADQVSAQGWAPDATSVGEGTAVGSYTRTVDDMELVGLLTIVALAEDTWDLKFRIVRKSATGAAALNRDVIGVRPQ